MVEERRKSVFRKYIRRSNVHCTNHCTSDHSLGTLLPLSSLLGPHLFHILFPRDSENGIRSNSNVIAVEGELCQQICGFKWVAPSRCSTRFSDQMKAAFSPRANNIEQFRFLRICLLSTLHYHGPSWHVSFKKTKGNDGVVFRTFYSVTGAYDDTRRMTEESPQSVDVGGHSTVCIRNVIVRFLEECVERVVESIT